MAYLATRRWFPLAALLGLCAVLFFYGINRGELYRTEGLRARVAAEGLASGDWLVPTLYGQPFLTKPPGMYAAVAAVSWPIGEVTEVTARLPSALAATATVLLFWWYFTQQLGKLGGFVAAALLPLSFMWLDKAPAAEIDALQVAWVSGAIIFFFRAIENEQTSLNDTLIAFTCLTAGTLTKWTAPAFYYGTALPLLAWRGRLSWLIGRQHLLGLALTITLCLSWLTVAGQRAGWDILAETVYREASQHLSPGLRQEAIAQMGAGHQSHLGYVGQTLLHPLWLLAMNAPWSLLALATLWPGFLRSWDKRGVRLWQALHCWLWPNLLFWSLLPQHSARHSFPLFPAFAGLAAMMWFWIWRAGPVMAPVKRDDGKTRFLGEMPLTGAITGPARLLLATLALWLVVKIAFVEAYVPLRLATRQTRDNGALLAAHVPADQMLRIGRLKDDTLLFYFGRPARRLADLGELRSNAEPMYCILEEGERASVADLGSVILRLHDGQGNPLVLLAVPPHSQESRP